MVTEKVQEIKRAEEKADAIIRRAQEQSEKIAASLETKVNGFRQSMEKEIAVETEKYRETVKKQTEESIALLRQEYLHRSASIREKSERMVTGVTDSVWNELKERLFMP